MLLYLSILALGFFPTINGQRVTDYGYQPPPYWLGVSIPPTESVSVEAIQGGVSLFTFATGTNTQLFYNTSEIPVDFYSNGVYTGSLVPEPLTFVLLLTGTIWITRRK